MSNDSPAMKVVKAQKHQADLVTQILAEAFIDDPVATWISPDTNLWLPPYFHSLSTHFFLPCGQVYVTKDGSGAALWLPPQRSMRNLPPLRSMEILWRIFSASGISAILRSMIAAVYLDIYYMKEPRYYLHVIGVRKKYAGQGIGTDLMQAALAQCDHEGVPAYLENSNIRNMAFYQRCGFKMIRKIQFFSKGPELWLMVRRPQAIKG